MDAGLPKVWPLLLLLAAAVAWSAASRHSGRFVEFIRAEDKVHVWINPDSVAQIRESITNKKLTMIVFSTGVWIDVEEPPARVVNKLSE